MTPPHPNTVWQMTTFSNMSQYEYIDLGFYFEILHYIFRNIKFTQIAAAETPQTHIHNNADTIHKKINNMSVDTRTLHNFLPEYNRNLLHPAILHSVRVQLHRPYCVFHIFHQRFIVCIIIKLLSME